MKKDILKNKYSFYTFTRDDREIGISIQGFSEFLVEVIKEVNLIFGDYYFSSDKDIIQIYLIIDCNNVNNEELQKSFDRNEIQFISYINFNEVIENEFKLSFFGAIIQSILNRIIFDLELGNETILKVDKLFTKLINNERLKYKNLTL